jgi:UDP-glucuronate 4-epimerase
MKCFADFKPDIVCNLAAQAGVRYSFENPYTYIESNVLGFLTILEACRAFQCSIFCMPAAVVFMA